MKLSHKITISSVWNEKKQVNETVVDFEQETTPSEILTVIEMGKIAINESLKSYVKNNYSNGQCTDQDFDIIMNTNFCKL